MKVISKQKRSLVIYDNKNDIFIKYFYPKFINRLKYFFRLRKYPGENYYFISNILNSLNINTAEIVSFTKYSVTTKNIHAPTLEEYIKVNENNKKILNQYIEIITTLLKNNVYCGDFAYDNFLVKNNKIIAIDLEDYKKVKFFKKNNTEALRRLNGKTDSDIIKKINENLTPTKKIKP